MLKKLLSAAAALVLSAGLGFAAFNLGFDGRFMPQGSGTAPALTGCGGGTPTIIGTDVAGTVTTGTTATGCVITFNVPYTTGNVPHCVVTSQVAPATSTPAYSVTVTAITWVQASQSGNKLNYFCAAQPGG